MSYLYQFFSIRFMAHRFCLRLPELVWLHALSDAVITVAYFLIPLSLVRLVRKRPDLQFSWLFTLFAIFILSCGTSHALAIVTLWIPIYGVEGLVKLVTAVASFGTAILFMRIMPSIAAIPSPQQWHRANASLQAQMVERERAESEVRLLNAELGKRVDDRTAELREQNRRLEELTTAWDLSTGFIRNFDGTISFWSEGAVQLYGWTKEQALGQKSHELLQTKFPKPLSQIEEDLVRHDSWNGELRHVTASGEVRYVASRWALKRGEAGNPASVIEVNTDISRFIRAERANAQLAAIVESSTDAIIGQNLEGLITSWNKSAESLYGYREDEIVGQPFSLLLPEGTQQAHCGPLAQTCTHEHRGRFQTRRVTKAGRKLTVVVTTSPICNAEGGVVGLSTISHDVTERKAISMRLRASQQRQRLSIEGGKIGLWFMNLNSGKTNWNDCCKELFGLAHHEPSPKLEEFLRFIHPDDVGQIREALDQSIKENKGFNLEFRVFAADGPLKWIQSTGDASTIRNRSGQEAHRLHGVAIDFTKRKHTEEELRRTNRDLEQFAYAAAHDLQEPLRNIAISLQLARATDLSQCVPEARQMLETAVDNARRMESMVKALLSFSRALDAPNEAVAAVQGNFALRLAMENLKTLIAETGAQITSDPLPRIAMRQFHLLQLFQNLLSNSMKYRRPEPLQIHVGVRDAVSEWIIWVRDNGSGIPPQYYDRVFRVFKRLRQVDAPGVGVGLSLCKRIVEHYEGRIWIESPAQHGVTFAFSVPKLKEK